MRCCSPRQRRSIPLPPDISARFRTAWSTIRDTPVDVTIILVDDAAMTRMNTRFRGKRRATDVLTFEYSVAGRPSSFDELTMSSGRAASPVAGTILHGEIYIALGVARRQARQRRVPLIDEFLRLGVHGLAHLAGYDHHTTQGFAAMRKKEFEAVIQIL